MQSKCQDKQEEKEEGKSERERERERDESQKRGLKIWERENEGGALNSEVM
jgi:hypothetical protein